MKLFKLKMELIIETLTQKEKNKQIIFYQIN